MYGINEKYETVIGLEVHAELKSETKIFCSCKTAFGAPPNTQCCPICMGLPGTLPVLNEKVLELALLAGVALNCQIAERSYHDRKNYFYPDLPKGYQISQFKRPLCTDGYIDMEKKRIGITQIHIEEDAGKLIHESGSTFIDLNRAGVPLIEIVSKPDISSASEAVEYLKKLRLILIYAGVSDCKMNEGQFRCDVNLSVRKKGDTKLGVRTEMKNINSFAFVAKAIEYEANRQAELIERGMAVERETRKYDSGRNVTIPLRKKEEASDYRFFRDPDLPTLEILPEKVEKIRASLPPMPDEKYALYTENYGILPKDAASILSEPALSAYFEKTAVLSSAPRVCANLILSELLSLCTPESLESDFPPESIASVSDMFDSETINSSTAKKLIRRIKSDKILPGETVISEGLMQINDEVILKKAVVRAMEEDPGAVSDYRSGKKNAAKAIMGRAMSKCRGMGNPRTVERIVCELLDSNV